MKKTILTFLLSLFFVASTLAQAQTVRVRERLMEIDNTTPKKGSVSFVLTKQATSAGGIIVAGASQTFDLVDGWLDARIIANDQLTPEQAYNVYYNAPSKNGVLMGLYSFTYSTAIQTLSANLVADVNKNARLKIANYGDVQAAMASAGAAGGTAGVTAAQQALAGSLANGAIGKWNSATSRFESAIPPNTGDSLLLGKADGSAGYVRIQDIAFPNGSTPVIQGLAVTGGTLSGAVTSSSTIDAGVPVVAYSALPSSPTTTRRAFVSSGPAGLPKDFYSYDVGSGFWIPEHGGAFVAAYYASGSLTLGIQEAYNAMTSNGGYVLLDRDYTITSGITISVANGKNLTIDLGGHTITESLASTGAGIWLQPDTAGNAAKYVIRNGKIIKGNTTAGVIALKAGFSISNVFLDDLRIEMFKETNDIAVNFTGCIDCAIDRLVTWENYTDIYFDTETIDVKVTNSKLNAGWNYASGPSVWIKGSGNIEFNNVLIQSHKTTQPVRIETTSTLPAGQIFFNRMHLENNGTESNNDTQFNLVSAGTNAVSGLTFIKTIINSGKGSSGSIIKTSGTVKPTDITSIGSSWSPGGYAKGLFEGFDANTNINKIGEPGVTNDSANVSIGGDTFGVGFGGQGSTKRFQLFAGYAGNYDGNFIFYNKTDSRYLGRIDQYGDWDFPNGGQLTGYSGVFTTQTWRIDSSNGNASFNKVLAANGTSGAPSYSFSTSTNTGMSWDGTSINFYYTGVRPFYINSTGIGASGVDFQGWWVAKETSSGGIGFGSGHKIMWGSSTTNGAISGDVGLMRDGTDRLAVTNGTAGTYRDIKARAFNVVPKTPSSSSDTSGTQGDIAADDSYIYFKTSTGWKRTALSTF